MVLKNSPGFLLGKRDKPERNSNQRVCGQQLPAKNLTPAEKRKATNLAKYAKGTASIFNYGQKKQKVEDD